MSGARIAIAGGGYAGAIAACHLLDCCAPGTTIEVFEPGAELGRGIAYARQPEAFALNVPADKLMAFPRDPDDFIRWARNTHGEACAAFAHIDGALFLPRSWFGDYMSEALAQRMARHRGRVVFRHVRDSILRIGPHPAGVRLTTGSGREVFAHAVILATGNGPPRPLPLAEHSEGLPDIIQQPWRWERLHQLAQASSSTTCAAIIGTGLSTADVIACLESADYRGKLVALSGRGRLPHLSRGVMPDYQPADATPARTARGALRQLRGWCAESMQQHGDWRPAMDYARRATAQLWQALPEAERARFQRHLRAQWEIHRYLMPPQTHAAVARLLAAGRLDIRRGKAEAVVAGGVQLRARGVRSLLRCDAVINATGLDATHATAIAPPPGLLAETGLDARGVARTGLDVDADGRVLGASAALNDRLWALGQLARANAGELGTVPQIGDLASRLAPALCGSLRRLPDSI